MKWIHEHVGYNNSQVRKKSSVIKINSSWYIGAPIMPQVLVGDSMACMHGGAEYTLPNPSSNMHLESEIIRACIDPPVLIRCICLSSLPLLHPYRGSREAAN